MTAGADLTDHRGRNPFALRVGDRDGAVGSKAQAVRVAKAGRQHLDRAAVGGEPQETLLARGGVEPPRGIALETAYKVVAPRRSFLRVGETLVEIGLTVMIEVVEPRDLIAAQNVNVTLNDDQAQCLVQTGREPPPPDLVERIRRDRRRARRRPASCRSWPMPSGRKSWSPKNSRAFQGLSKRRLDRIDDVGPRGPCRAIRGS